MLRSSARSAAVLVALLGLTVGASEGASASADEPVQVVADNSTDSTPSYSLTLETAGTLGGLSPTQIEQAVAAAQQASQAAAGASGGAAGGSGDGGGVIPAGGGGATSGQNGINDPVAFGECQWGVVDLPARSPAWAGSDPATGSLLANACNGGQRYLYVPNSAFAAAGAVPLPPPDPAVLAQQARTELTLPKPTVRRSPPETNSDPDNGGLPYTWVGLSTFYWVEGWQSMTRTVELRGVSATVTATPTGLTFDPGDGSAAVSCAGPGRPWTQADGDNPPSGSACGYTYRSVTPNGPLTATTSVQWSVNWTSNTGANGTFPASTTSSSLSFLVEQIQVVVR